MSDHPCLPDGAETELVIDGQVVPANLCNVRAFWSRREASGVRRQAPVEINNENVAAYYPALSRILQSSNWILKLDVDDGEILINPATIYWRTSDGKRSTVYNLEENPSLELEFLYEGGRNRRLRSLMLLLKESTDDGLEAAIFSAQTTGLLRQLYNWISQYQGAVAPQTIDQNGIARLSGAGFFSTAIASLELQVFALAAALQASVLPEGRFFKELALLLATGIFQGFLGGAFSLPQEFISASQVASEEIAYDLTVSFINGVGQGPEDIERLFAVYDGTIAYGEESVNLISGTLYIPEFWVKSDGSLAAGSPGSPRTIVSTPESGKVIYASSLDLSLNLYSIFSLAVV